MPATWKVSCRQAQPDVSEGRTPRSGPVLISCPQMTFKLPHMQTSQTFSVEASDQIASCIENFLLSEESRGHGKLVRKRTKDGVCLRFGAASATSATYDIALIRLGHLLLDDPHFARPLREVLRPFVRRHFEVKRALVGDSCSQISAFATAA